MPAPAFKSMAREPTLADRVTAELEGMIAGNQLRPGDSLPSVQELADQFGVSRTVVREAIRSLVARNLLEVRHGSGTTVRRPTAQNVAESIAFLLRTGAADFDFMKIVEVRLHLEVEIAGLAAERHTDADIVALEASVQEMAALNNDRDRLAQNDVAFHTTLAHATHNELYVVLIDSLGEIMLTMRQMAFDLPGKQAEVVAYHAAVLEQVRAGNAEGARQAMRAHLGESEATIRQVLALRQAETQS